MPEPKPGGLPLAYVPMKVILSEKGNSFQAKSMFYFRKFSIKKSIFLPKMKCIIIKAYNPIDGIKTPISDLTREGGYFDI